MLTSGIVRKQFQISISHNVKKVCKIKYLGRIFAVADYIHVLKALWYIQLLMCGYHVWLNFYHTLLYTYYIYNLQVFLKGEGHFLIVIKKLRRCKETQKGADSQKWLGFFFIRTTALKRSICLAPRDDLIMIDKYLQRKKIPGT